MNVLLFIDPACGERGFLPSAANLADLARAFSGPASATAVAVCAPGLDSAFWSAASRNGATPRLLPIDGDSAAFIAAIAPLLAPGGVESDSLPLQRRTEYAAGRGAAAGRLIELFKAIRSGSFAYDLVLTAGKGQAASLAAASVGARFARLHHWPIQDRRWRPFGFVESRNAAGRSVMDGLTADHLRAAGLPTLPAAVDQRLLGRQREINPWESAFAPLRGASARAFSTERRVALLALGQSGRTSPAETGPLERDDDSAQRLGSAIKRLLDDGWRIVVLDGIHPTALMPRSLRERDGVYVLPPEPEPVSKRDRRDRLALLAQADLLLTDDSGMALEAALYEKPVCVLGRPFFNLPGLFLPLDRAMNPDFDFSSYRADLALLRTFLLRCWGAPWAELIAGRRLHERICDLAELNDRCVDDPVGWLRELDRRYGGEARKATLLSLLKREAELEPLGGN